MADDTNTLNTTFTADIGDILAKFSGMLKGIMDLAASSTPFAAAMGISDVALKTLETTVGKVQGSVTSFADALKAAGNDSVKLGSVLKSAVDGVNSVAESLTKTKGRTDEYNAALRILKDEAGSNTVMLSGMKKELNELDKAHSAYAAGQPDKAFKDTYTAINLAQDAVTNYVSKGNLLNQSAANILKGQSALNKEFELGEFKTSSLGKAFAVSSSKGDAFFEALVKGGDAFGINTPKINSFITSLFDVNKHLEAIPKSSLNGTSALKELGDGTRLSQLAMGLMSGELVKVKDGFQIVSGKIKESGTAMGENSTIAASLYGTHKNLGTVLQDYITIQGKNSSAIKEGANRLLEYEKVVSQTKAAFTNIAVASTTAAGGYGVYASKANDAVASNKKLNNEMAGLEGGFHKIEQLSKVVSGEFEVTAASVANLSREILANSPVTAILADKYNGVSEGLKKVSAYGDVYTESLQRTLDAQTKDTASIDRAVNAHLTYARTAETMISQNRAIYDSMIQNWNSSTKYNGALISQTDYMQICNTEHDKFKNLLRSEELIVPGVTQSHKNLGDELLNNAKNTLGSNTATERMYAIQGSLIPMVEEHRAKITELNNAIITQKISTTEGFTAFAQYKQGIIDTAKAAEELKRKQEEQNEALKATPGFFSKIASSIMETVQSFAVYQIASAIISTFIGSITALVANTTELDQVLHSLKAITNSTSVEMAGMAEVIKTTAASSIYGIAEIGSSLTVMAQAGLSAGDSVNTLKASVNLATGTLEKLENTVDLITSTMSSYQISTIESGRVSDILAIACNESKLSIDKLRTSLNYVGVIAAQSGLSLEQTSASLMVLADRGMKASTIGTGFRQVLDKLIAPNEKLREAYQAHGIALDKISPLTAGYEDALKNLSIALYDSDTKTVNTAKAFELFGIRGAQAAAILIQSYTSGEWKEAMNSFSDSGAAARMAAEQLQGLGGMWDNLKAKVGALAATIGEGGLVAALKMGISTTSAFVQGLLSSAEWIDKQNFVVRTLLGSLAALAAIYSTTIFLLTVWGTGSAYAAIQTSFLSIAITSLKNGFHLLTAAMMTNPLVAFSVIMVTLISLTKVYESKIQDITDKHNKLSNEAGQSANAITLFSKVLTESKDDTESFKNNVNRLKNEFPELTKEIAEMAGVGDISKLTFEELSTAMSKVKDAQLKKALDESVAALLMMMGTTDEARESVDHFNFSVGEEGPSKKFTETLKSIALNAVAAAKAVGGSYEEQKIKAVESIDAQIKANVSLGKYRDELVKKAIDDIDKQEAREKASKLHYETYVKEMSVLWGGLSAKQRADIQSVIDEEEKSVEKFTKFANDKKIAIDERENEIYAIRLKFQLKALGLLSESVKKEYETQDEKLNREANLLDRRLELIKAGIAKEQMAYSKLDVSKFTDLDKYYEAVKIHLGNIATLHEQQQVLIRSQVNLTFESQKKILSDYVSEVKNSITLQATLLEAFELEKLKLLEKGSEVLLKAKQFEIEEIERVMQAEINAIGVNAAAMETYRARTKVLLNEEIALRTEVINKILEIGKYWLERSNTDLDQSLAYTKDVYKQKEAMAQSSYDHENFLLKSNLEKKLIQIVESNKNESIIDVLKNTAKLKYYDDEVKLAEKLLNTKLELSDQEYNKLNEISANKLAINEKYINAVKGLYSQSGNDRITIEKYISTQEIMSNAEKYAEISRIQREYQDSIKGLYEDVNSYLTGIERTSLAEHVKKLNYQLIADQQYQESWKGINDDIYASYPKETEIAKIESNNRVQNRIQKIAEEGLTVDAQLAKYQIAYVKETELSKAQLKEQGFNYVSFGNDVYRVITEKVSNVDKGLQAETKLHRTAQTEITKLTTEQIQGKIKDYENSISKIKTSLDAEYQLHAAIVEKIKKLREDLVTSAMSFDELRRKTLQSTMTDEEKYYNDKTAFEKALQKVQETGLKIHYDDAMAKLTALTSSDVKSGERLVLSAKETTSIKIGFLNDLETVNKKMLKDEIQRLQDLEKATKLSIEVSEKKLDDLMAKLKEFQDMEINIKTEKVTKSTEQIKKELDGVIAKLKSIEGEAPIKVDIEDVKTKLSESTQLIDKLIIQIQKSVIPPIIVRVAGVDGVPLSDYLDMVKKGIDFVFSEMTTNPKIVPLNFVGKVGTENTTLPIAVTEVKTQIVQLTSDLQTDKSLQPNVTIPVQGNTDAQTNKPITEIVKDVKQEIAVLKTDLWDAATNPMVTIEFLMDVGGAVATSFSTGIEWVVEKIKQLVDNPTKSTHDVVVTGVMDLQAAIDKHSQLDGEHTYSYHTVYVNTVEGSSDSGTEEGSRTGGYISSRVGGFIQKLRSGGAFSGQLPGYGGGDIVNAKLEPGEFVLRKEAVKKIGVNALRQWNNLNSSAGKSLNVQETKNTTESLFSGQLHTINLNIGNVVHRVYGESNVLSQLTSSMRRARLMTA